MLRRTPFALPRAEQLPALVEIVAGDGAVAPDDPEAFVEAAASHRVVGAAVTALTDGRLVLPPGPERTLRDAHAVGVLRSALLRRELSAVAEPVARVSTGAPIVLKGPAIADRFYRASGLRTFSDLDLLVAPERLPAASAALSGLGYEELVELREGFGASQGHDVHMARELGQGRVDVELHWRVGDDRLGEALSHSSLAGRAVPAGQVAAATYPSAPDQLLVCAMHLLSDRLKRLCWVEDMRRVATALDDSAWRESFERARELGLLWVLHRGLDYAQHHLGYVRDRPLPAGDPPQWGPLRAVEELDLGASLHLGRLAAMPWPQRPSYLRQVLIPSRRGLRGTVGGDGAGGMRLAARHLIRAVRGLRPRR